MSSVESRMFCGLCDAVVLVVRCGDTPLSMVKEAAMVIREAGGAVAGAILVDVDVEPARASRVHAKAGRVSAVPQWSNGLGRV